MLLSVIIPVYNTGIYLKRCVESVCNQTLRDLELIIVDDGSAQETADICDELAASDTRIRVTHTKNNGVSVARNIGLSIAQGDYIGFVDSDDWIEADMYQSMIQTAMRDNSQVVVCDAVTKRLGNPDEQDVALEELKDCILTKEQIKPAMLTRLAGSAWRCIYRRTDMPCFASLRFPEGLKFSEDRIFNIKAIGMANRISYIRRPFYNRLIRAGSACFRFYPDMTGQIAKMRPVLLEAVKQYWGDAYLQAYERQMAGHILFAVTNYTASYNGLSAKEQVNYLCGLCDNASIQTCLQASAFSDIRTRMIQQHMVRSLYVVGKVTNLLHRLCKKGQYQQ